MGSWRRLLTLESELHGRLFIRLFEELSDSSRHAWWALALIPQPVEPAMLSRAWGISVTDVSTLGRHGLTETTGEGQVRLVGAAREAVRQAYDEHVIVRSHIDHCIAGLSALSGSFDVIEHALVSGFPEIPPELRSHWVSLAWREGLRRSHWALWRTILETELANVTEFTPNYTLPMPYACAVSVNGMRRPTFSARSLLNAGGAGSLPSRVGRLLNGAFLRATRAIIGTRAK